MNNLTALYQSRLQVLTATSSADRKEAFRLRHQVYCIERGFEPPAASLVETDAHDDAALHFITRHRDTRQVLGVTRLIMDEPTKGRRLPIEAHNLSSVRDHLADLRRLNRAKVAEVSRLAVTRDVKRLCVERTGRNEERIDDEPRIHSQHVSMGLLAILFRKSLDAGVTHWVALLDSALVRCYSRLGVKFEPIGPTIDHRGPRTPIMTNLADIWRELQTHCPPLAKLIREFPSYSDTSRAPAQERPSPATTLLYGELMGSLVAASA